MRILTVETTTHGRVLVDDAAGDGAGWLVAFHGYGQNADDILSDVRRIPGIDRWRIASVQALNRFYTRDEGVVASWMTRQDREIVIADNIAYVDKAIDAILASRPTPHAPRLVFAGFSQGAAMAYRAGVLGRHHPAGIIALGGDVPPEVTAAGHRAHWPKVLLGAGRNDRWYTSDKVDHDEAFLRACGIDYEVVRFNGGHEWNEEFRAVAGRWLGSLAPRA